MRAVSDECDGRVEGVDRWASWLHRIACRPCRRAAGQIRLVDRLLKSAPPDAVEGLAIVDAEARLSPEAAARIAASLAELVEDDE